MTKLGQTVEDTVSGFKGVVIARTEWLNGCTRICVQPRVNEKGELPDAKDFDEPQLRVMDEAAHRRGSVDTGGPTSHSPSQNATPSR